ncbi:hypothetical protein D9M72_148620 [compost metagenome]
MARGRGQEGQAEFGVFGDVAVRVQVDVLAPVARLDELLVRVAVHPLVVVVVVGQRIVRRALPEGLAHGHALAVEPVGHVAHGALRAFVVDVPALEVLQRRGVHHHQRRVDDGAGVHQRARERVAAAVHGRVGAADHLDGLRLLARRVDAGGQADRADGDVDFALAVLARKVRQGAGLGPGHVGAVAGGLHRLRHHVAAEGARRQEHDLAVDQVRRHGQRDVVLGDGGRGNDDEFGALQRGADVGGGERDGHLARTGGVFQRDRAGLHDGFERGGVAAPQAHFMAGFRQVRGGRIGAVATPKNRNFHDRKSRTGVDEPAAANGPGRSNAPLHYFSSIQVSTNFMGAGVLGNPTTKKPAFVRSAGFWGKQPFSGPLAGAISGWA